MTFQDIWNALPGGKRPVLGTIGILLALPHEIAFWREAAARMRPDDLGRIVPLAKMHRAAIAYRGLWRGFVERVNGRQARSAAAVAADEACALDTLERIFRRGVRYGLYALPKGAADLRGQHAGILDLAARTAPQAKGGAL